MSSWFSSQTYDIKNILRTPLVRGFLFFFLVGLGLTLAAQWVGSSALNASLPPPSVDTRNPEFNAKVNYLELFARRYGKVDCLLLGSSHTDLGLDPKIIAQIYRDKTGREIHCFNFGLVTLTADTAAPLAELLVQRYHPSLLVYEVSARSFDHHFGDLARPLVKNPWIRYQLGERLPVGWLLDNFYAYQYYQTFKLWQNPYSRKILFSNWKEMDSSGFAPSSGQRPPEADDIVRLKFKMEPADWNGFLDALSLNGQTHLVVFEAPVKPSYLPNYLAGGVTAYETEFIRPVAAELSARGIPFWRAQLEVASQIPDSMWFDFRHVNAQGAVVFSNWLGEKMVEAIPPGVFK